MTAAAPSTPPVPRSFLRFWLPVLIVGGATAALVGLWAWPAESLERGVRGISSVMVSVLSLLLLSARLLFLRHRRRFRRHARTARRARGRRLLRRAHRTGALAARIPGAFRGMARRLRPAGDPDRRRRGRLLARRHRPPRLPRWGHGQG